MRRRSSSATHGFRLDRVTRDPIVSLAPKDAPRTMIMRDDRSPDFVLLLASPRQRLKGDSDRRADETTNGLVTATDFVSWDEEARERLGRRKKSVCSEMIFARFVVKFLQIDRNNVFDEC